MYVLLYLLWLVLNQSLRPEVLFTGLGAVALVGLLAWPLFGYTPRTEWRNWKRAPFLVAYFALVALAVVKASLAMMSYIWNRKKPLEPCLFTLETELSTSLGRFLLANSITLTPGTITVKLSQNRLTVHAMSAEMLEGASDGQIARLLKKMEEVAG